MTDRPRRKSDAARRANQVIRGRTMLIMLLLGVASFTVLFWKLYDLQINRHDELKAEAVSQQTDSMVISASRGTIYDKNGEIMAISYSTETVLLDPGGVPGAEDPGCGRGGCREGSALHGAGGAGPGVYRPGPQPHSGCGGGDHPGAPGEHRQPILGGQKEGRPGRGRRGPPVHQRRDRR